jgi:hypothetical protein
MASQRPRPGGNLDLMLALADRVVRQAEQQRRNRVVIP